MDNEANKKKRRVKPARQDWKPHWIIRILLTALSTAWGVVKIALGAVITVLLVIVVCGFVFVGILGDYLQNDILVESKSYELSISDLDQTSFVYALDRDGNIQLIQRIHTTVDREWASIDEIPEDLINATIAIEDKRFYEHQGVDWITTMKACVNMFMGGSSTFGGSTITQQLIKNLTGEDSVTVQRKVMEIFRAVYAEKSYEKDTIMEWYLNTIYLGNGCYGVKSAAASYFGKELRTLTAAECASLISITNNPSLFGPYSSTLSYQGEMTTGAERNRIRQTNVLYQMYEQEMLTEEEYEASINEGIIFKEGIDEGDTWNVCSSESCDYEGILSTYSASGSNYYCPVCGTLCEIELDNSQDIYSWFVDAAIEDVAAELAALDGVDWDSLDTEGKKVYLVKIQRGGYHIYITMDMDVQAQVDAIYQNLSEIPNTSSAQQLQSAIVVIDNTTGDIVAMAGGVGEKDTHDAYNRATDALLQTGSSMKPLTVYAPAFELGAISPASVVTDLPISYSGGAWPKNDNRKYNYSRTIYQGVTSSVNAVAVHTLDMIGFDYSLSFAKNNLGISTLVESYTTASGNTLTDLGYAPLAMGALTRGATVREMTQAYATFANNGVFREARTYTKVYDSAGNLVLNNTQSTYEAMSTSTVNYMNYCLYNAANSGTGSSAVFSGQIICGKTGTTSSNKDRWFCGFTSHYTAAVWTGYDTPEAITLSSNPACALWKKVMQPIHSGLSKESLYSTSGMRSVSVCLDSGLLATEACGNDVRGSRTASAYCYSSDIPKGYCDKHVSVEYCDTGDGVATEYCKLFAELEDPQIKIKLSTVSLVKLTKSEAEDLDKASDYGLVSTYTMDEYVYLVDKNGDPVDWFGFSGNANKGQHAPYIICTEHTKEAYEEYVAAKEEEERKKQEEEDRKKQEEEDRKKQEEEDRKKQEEEDRKKQEQEQATEPSETTPVETTDPAQP